MDDVLRQAAIVLRAMAMYRRLGVGVAWAVGVLGALIVMLIPNQYEASARVFVDTQSILKPLMVGLAVQPNVEQQMAMLTRTLMTRPNLEKLVRMAELDGGSSSKSRQDALVERLTKTLQIRSTTHDNLFTLAYRDSDAEQAKRVVQSLLSIFVESNLGQKRKDSEVAKRFIEDQIKIYEVKLREAEARLKEFKVRNAEMPIGDGRGGAAHLEDMLNDLNAARLELREAERSRDSLRRQLRGEEPVPGAGPDDIGAVPEIDGRIEALKRSLDGLLQRYTEQHPDVVGTRRIIRELEEQKRHEVAVQKKTGRGSRRSPNPSDPVYQELKVSLAETEANIASLQARVAEYEARYARVKETIKAVPQLEAEFTQLNRDYDVHKRNYEQLVTRRESASLTGEVESASGGDFRVIDPPRVSRRPVAPNRMALLATALVAALLSGVFATFLASKLKPVYLDASSVREDTGLPLLGTVSLMANEAQAEREKRSLKHALIALGMLVAAYGAGIALIVGLSTRSG